MNEYQAPRGAYMAFKRRCRSDAIVLRQAACILDPSTAGPVGIRLANWEEGLRADNRESLPDVWISTTLVSDSLNDRAAFLDQLADLARPFPQKYNALAFLVEYVLVITGSSHYPEIKRILDLAFRAHDRHGHCEVSTLAHQVSAQPELLDGMRTMWKETRNEAEHAILEWYPEPA